MLGTQEIPEQIGKYRISCILGKGAMGTVFKGFDTVIERIVAVKVLHSHLLEGEEGESLSLRFKQEAKAAARCLHPNIVTVFDYGVENDIPYIVMEYVEGAELKDVIKRQQVNSVVQAIKIMQQILAALELAHKNGIVHRDIKPANIIILNDGQVKVSDFGVARLDTSDLTSAGYMVGTPNYMSPEGLRGLQVDARSDLYSCALLLLEIITSAKPYAGRNTDELLNTLNEQTLLDPGLKQGLQKIIRKALQEAPENRYQSARELNQVLGTLIELRHEEEDDQKTIVSPIAANTNFSGQGFSTQSQIEAWNPDLLKMIENSLVKYVGPMASALIRKNSKSASGISDLSQQLAEYIPSEEEKQKFLRQLRQTGIYEIAAETGISPAQAPPPPTFSHGIEETKIKSLAKLLTPFLGPIAPRMVKMEAKKVNSVSELIDKLCQHIPNTEEQKKFRKFANTLEHED